MIRARLQRSVPVVLTLALFLGWLGIGALHHHADQPGCEICKAMHNGAANLPRLADAQQPVLRAEPVAPPAAPAIASRSLPHHLGRAPPAA
jgi:hypothetical protein